MLRRRFSSVSAVELELPLLCMSGEYILKLILHGWQPNLFGWCVRNAPPQIELEASHLKMQQYRDEGGHLYWKLQLCNIEVAPVFKGLKSNKHPQLRSNSSSTSATEWN